MFKYYLPHLTFFIAFFAAAVPILYYIQRKNPNPRFRPGFGEMSLITLIALFIARSLIGPAAEAVAVATLPPAAEAPMQSDIALCSDSAQTYSVLTSPLATNSAKFSTIMVCGVIG